MVITDLNNAVRLSKVKKGPVGLEPSRGLYFKDSSD